MDKAGLITACASYLHRTDMAAQLDAAIAIATNRIGRDLRSANNFITNIYTPADNGFLLPDDLIEIRDLVDENRRVYKALTPAQLVTISAPQLGNSPYYAVNGKLLFFPAASNALTFTITYFAQPAALVADTDTNDVLTAYPQLYLYAVLMESFFFTQDGDLAAYAKATYEQEIEKINAVFMENGLGSSPAMRRVY